MCRQLVYLSARPAADLERSLSRGDVSDKPKTGEAVVESHPENARPTRSGADELRDRIRQQQILSELSVRALQSGTFEELLNETARLSAEGLDASLSKVLRLLPDRSGFLIVAGYGWPAEIMGKEVIGADTASPAGYALQMGKPVISNHLEHEQRFRTPELLASYGVKRAINVIIQGEGAPFGVLEVDSRYPGEFSESDLPFLQGAGNIIGMAIERHRYEQQLKGLLDHQQSLLREVNHRVKNSLQLVASMLRLQVAGADEGAKRLLSDAQARVLAIARAHERLYRTADFTHLDLGIYIREVGTDLYDGAIRLDLADDIRISTDRAIPLALLVTELVTNSMKYAYPDGRTRPIWVKLAPVSHDQLEITVADEGVGFPEDFDPDASRGLGMRLVKAFAQRLNAKIDFRNRHPGAEVVISLPRED